MQKLPITIKGTVIRGWQRGRELGFPTVNIKSPQDTQIAKQGIYAGIIKVVDKKYNGKTFLAACSTGYNKTFDAKRPTIEAHIIDFDDDIYGVDVELALTHYIRNMIAFDSIDDLANQIKKDVELVKSNARGGDKFLLSSDRHDKKI